MCTQRLAASVFTALAVLSLAVTGSFGQGGGTATATDTVAADIPVAPPARMGGPAYLDFAVTSYKTPRQGSVEAVVTLRAGESGTGIEVGRFAVFPHASFEAKGTSDARAYRFNVSNALSRLGPPYGALTLHLKLEPIDAKVSASGAAMTIGSARIIAE
jgi:hypothetical protein